MGPKTGNSPLKKAPTINRKGHKNCDNNNPFLSSESNIAFGFWLFWQQNNTLSSLISKHFLLLFFKRLIIMVLFQNGPLREKR